MHLAYTPRTKYTDQIMEYVRKKMNLTKSIALGDLVSLIYYMGNSTLATPLAGVAFDHVQHEMPDQLKVTLLFPAELRNPSKDASPLNWVTDLLFPMFESTAPRNLYMPDGGSPPGYYREAFVTVQHYINTAVILEKSQLKEEDLPAVFVQRFTDPKMRVDKIHTMLKLIMPLIFFLTFLYPTFSNVKVS